MGREATGGRICLFVPSLVIGGAERVTANLAGGLAERGLQVDLVVVTSRVAAVIEDIHPAVRLIDLDAGRALFCLPRLVHYLRRERPVALLSALEHTNIMALLAARLAGVDTRVVVSVHTTLSRDTEDSRQLRARIFPRLVRWFYPWASSVVAVSEAAREDLLATTGLKPSSVRVIFNPVVTPQIHRKAAEPVPHPWFAAGQPPVILGIGRMVSAKNFPLLIRAFARLRRRHMARLVILGDGELRGAMQELARELEITDEVLLPGFSDNPYAYLSRAALFVLSSSYEGLPTVLIEALALGVPVVSTSCPSGPAEILQGGRFGELVEVGDEQGLAEAMLRSLQRPRGAENSVLAWQPYQLDRVVRQYLELLLPRAGR